MASKSACPDIDTLIRFSQGALAPEEAGSIQNHLDECGVCDHLAEQARVFELESRQDSEPPGWPQAERRLDAHFEKILMPPKPNRLIRLLRQPALAYALVAVLAFPAYVGITRRNQEVVPAPAAGSARIVDLNQTRSVTAGPPAAGGSESAIVLSFFVPIETGLRYRATLTNGSGRLILSAEDLWSYDGKGNFYLVCNRKLLTTGDYSLTVTGPHGPPHSFAFTL